MGKTTTIRLLLDVIRPTRGRITVLGLDPRDTGVRARIGYLPGELALEGREKAGDYLAFLGEVRGGVPRHRIEGLAERLEADLSVPMGKLSKGNKQKVGLIQAFMHEPEFLILDEPTGGLDPLVQQEFLAMVREVRISGRTVLMPSHVLAEVENVSDRVGIVRAARLVLERLAALAIGLLAVGLVTFALVAGMASAIDMGVPLGNIAAAHAGLYLLVLFFGTLTVAVGAATGRKGLALTVSGVWAVGGYVVETLGRDVAAISWLRPLSPFHYYLDGKPLYQGFPVGDYGVLAGATVVLVLAAMVTFDRRDVGV